MRWQSWQARNPGPSSQPEWPRLCWVCCRSITTCIHGTAAAAPQTDRPSPAGTAAARASRLGCMQAGAPTTRPRCCQLSSAISALPAEHSSPKGTAGPAAPLAPGNPRHSPLGCTCQSRPTTPSSCSAGSSAPLQGAAGGGSGGRARRGVSSGGGRVTGTAGAAGGAAGESKEVVGGGDAPRTAALPKCPVMHAPGRRALLRATGSHRAAPPRRWQNSLSIHKKRVPTYGHWAPVRALPPAACTSLPPTPRTRTPNYHPQRRTCGVLPGAAQHIPAESRLIEVFRFEAALAGAPGQRPRAAIAGQRQPLHPKGVAAAAGFGGGRPAWVHGRACARVQAWCQQQALWVL